MGIRLRPRCVRGKLLSLTERAQHSGLRHDDREISGERACRRATRETIGAYNNEQLRLLLERGLTRRRRRAIELA